ncbi:hypothetical protein CCP3SC1AL1_3440002 [Gammaproteobacteria bacterium]
MICNGALAAVVGGVLELSMSIAAPRAPMATAPPVSIEPPTTVAM